MSGDWCVDSIGVSFTGVRFNAEKKQAGNYFSTKIWQFTMKCHLCNNKIVVTTDPKTTQYLMTSGARAKVVNCIPYYICERWSQVCLPIFIIHDYCVQNESFTAEDTSDERYAMSALECALGSTFFAAANMISNRAVCCVVFGVSSHGIYISVQSRGQLSRRRPIVRRQQCDNGSAACFGGGKVFLFVGCSGVEEWYVECIACVSVSRTDPCSPDVK